MRSLQKCLQLFFVVSNIMSLYCLRYFHFFQSIMRFCSGPYHDQSDVYSNQQDNRSTYQGIMVERASMKKLVIFQEFIGPAKKWRNKIVHSIKINLIDNVDLFFRETVNYWYKFMLLAPHLKSPNWKSSVYTSICMWVGRVHPGEAGPAAGGGRGAHQRTVKQQHPTAG